VPYSSLRIGRSQESISLFPSLLPPHCQWSEVLGIWLVPGRTSQSNCDTDPFISQPLEKGAICTDSCPHIQGRMGHSDPLSEGQGQRAVVAALDSQDRNERS
jgi:hypothetical protein